MECKLNLSQLAPPKRWPLTFHDLQLVLRLMIIATEYPERFETPIATYHGEMKLSQLENQGKKKINRKEVLDAIVQELEYHLGLIPYKFDMTKIPLCCQIIIVNQSVIRPCGLDGLGVGLFVSTCVFDYSCSPNCFQVFEGINMKVRAIKEFNSQSEPPLLAYVEPRLHQVHVSTCCVRTLITPKCASCESRDCFSDRSSLSLKDWVRASEKINKAVSRTKNFVPALDAGLQFLSHEYGVLPSPHPFRTFLLVHLYNSARLANDKRKAAIAQDLYKNFQLTHGMDSFFYQEYKQIIDECALF